VNGPHRSDPGYWREVEEVFSAAIDVEPAARGALLEQRCGSRANLKADVEALLTSHDRAGDFIQPRTQNLTAALDAATVSAAGMRAGSFTLGEPIGEGGMGTVYRAERVEGGFSQRAAVKIIASRLSGREAIRRFATERQILASLHHPNIVTLLDGGVTESGQPYLAMELIEGRPITDYCRARGIGLEQRLRLFLERPTSWRRRYTASMPVQCAPIRLRTPNSLSFEAVHASVSSDAANKWKPPIAV
jgi:serine/threonine-protein kinase